jgi:murein DD-endopeptidase MepM/ murein hydrolase activator NlpD
MSNSNVPTNVLTWPVTSVTITQGFGENPDDYARFGYPGHNGLDMVGNSSILDALLGVVEKVGWEEGGYGKYIVVKSGNVSTYYAHLSNVYVAPGDLVVPDQPIAFMGSTGNSTGVHLHFGLRIGKLGEYKGFVDPLPYLQGELLPPFGPIVIPPTATYIFPVSKRRAKTVTHGKRTMYPSKKPFYF